MGSSVDVGWIKWLSFCVEDGNTADGAIKMGGRSWGNGCWVRRRERGPGVDCRWPGTGDLGSLGGGDFGVSELKVQCLG